MTDAVLAARKLSTITDWARLGLRLLEPSFDNPAGPCHAYARYMDLAALITECACLKVRTAARAVTRVYDDALRPVGLRGTQLSVLVAVAFGDAVSIASLSRTLGMDRSTLTRNLRPLEEQELVVLGPETHHRSRTLGITQKGQQLVRKALPIWEKTQEKLRAELKQPHWTNLHAELDHVIKAAEAI
jgi:DNA-binding MarR family transcriptional regulator